MVGRDSIALGYAVCVLTYFGGGSGNPYAARRTELASGIGLLPRALASSDLLALYPLRIYAVSVAKQQIHQPPTPAVFHILLALSGGDLHGYGIMKQVIADSERRVSMGAGTLYGSLKRMLDAGLVKESAKRIDPELDDERRIYYAITGLGKKALGAEIERLQHVVELSRRRKLLPRRSVSVA